MCLVLYQVVTELRKNFNKGILREVESRLRILKQFNTMIDECENEICEAVYKDLRKVSASYLKNSNSVMFSTYNLVTFRLYGEMKLFLLVNCLVLNLKHKSWNVNPSRPLYFINFY